MFIAQFGTAPGADTPCGTATPHADINGDGLVGTPDFTYIQSSFLASSELDCDGNLLLAGDERGSIDPVRRPIGEPRERISVSELDRLGMRDLVGADLDRDGDLDSGDIAAFFAGARPDHLADLNSDGSVDTSDMLVFAERYHEASLAADVNRDGRVDLGDLVFIADRLGIVIPR